MSELLKVKSSKSWMKILGPSLGLPGTILTIAYICWVLTQNKIVSRKVALIILLTWVGGMLFWIFCHAFDLYNKDKSKNISSS
ncbi:MAG: hypothetical protein OXB84_03835 [Halobacteriovoraceae bacterium]|nr:hypothetical protein [Halobacteriovoraceae bacterium]